MKPLLIGIVISYHKLSSKQSRISVKTEK